MLRPQDRPLFLALLSIPFALALTVALPPSAPQIISEPNSPQQQATPPPQNSDFPWETVWIFCTFAATSVLALYAVRQFVDNRRSSERQLRAYISAIPEQMVLAQDNETITALVTLKNTGKTPAFDAWAAGTLCVMEYPMAEPREANITGDNPAPTYVIFPDGQHIQGFSKKRFEILFPDDKHALYALGRITYRDAFGRTQWTDYCAALERAAFNEWLAKAEKKLGHAFQARFKFTPFNNGASENLS